MFSISGSEGGKVKSQLSVSYGKARRIVKGGKVRRDVEQIARILHENTPIMVAMDKFSQL